MAAAANAQIIHGPQAFGTECGGCHEIEEVRAAVSGLRRLYWTDHRLERHLRRHHARDEEQARAIVRFLRGVTTFSPL